MIEGRHQSDLFTLYHLVILYVGVFYNVHILIHTEPNGVHNQKHVDGSLITNLSPSAVTLIDGLCSAAT